MIEQTELVVTQWQYDAPEIHYDEEINISNKISLDIMQKRAGIKKGIACRFTCFFFIEEKIILEYVAEDSYVIDLEDTIDKIELLTMIRNSYSKFNDKFDLRKLGTLLHNRALVPLQESSFNIDAILPLLQ